jgi:hypothetical protein
MTLPLLALVLSGACAACCVVAEALAALGSGAASTPAARALLPPLPMLPLLPMLLLPLVEPVGLTLPALGSDGSRAGPRAAVTLDCCCCWAVAWPPKSSSDSSSSAAAARDNSPPCERAGADLAVWGLAEPMAAGDGLNAGGRMNAGVRRCRRREQLRPVLLQLAMAGTRELLATSAPWLPAHGGDTRGFGDGDQHRCDAFCAREFVTTEGVFDLRTSISTLQLLCCHISNIRQPPVLQLHHYTRNTVNACTKTPRNNSVVQPQASTHATISGTTPSQRSSRWRSAASAVAHASAVPLAAGPPTLLLLLLTLTGMYGCCEAPVALLLPAVCEAAAPSVRLLPPVLESS